MFKIIKREMKQQWAPQELIDHWMLTDAEKILVNTYHTDPNKVACALLLKYFQREGRFPQRKQDMPRVIVEHIAQQFHLATTVFDSYRWEPLSDTEVSRCSHGRRC